MEVELNKLIDKTRFKGEIVRYRGINLMEFMCNNLYRSPEIIAINYQNIEQNNTKNKTV